MKILITGSEGQLGSELTEVLKDMRSDLGPIPEVYRHADIICVDIGTLDISDNNALNEFRAMHEDDSFDLILHCAAMTNVDACESDHEAALKGNAVGAGNIARFAKNQDAKLVHISTDYVFDGKSSSPYVEWDITGPANAYGKSKLLGEKYVQANCDRSFIVRTSWLYGETGNNFVKTIRKIAAEKESITVVHDQVGNPTYTNDLADHILKIGAGEAYGIYHVTGNGVCSWYEFAKEIVRLSGLKCEVVPVSAEEFPRPAPRPAFSAMDHVMLRMTVGDEMRPWQEALAAFIEKIS